LEESESLPFRPIAPGARPVEISEKTLPKSLSRIALLGRLKELATTTEVAVGKECVGRFKAPAPSHWLGAR
jgi:hypothetical protein